MTMINQNKAFLLTTIKLSFPQILDLLELLFFKKNEGSQSAAISQNHATEPSENHELETQQGELERLHEQQALLQKIVDQQNEVSDISFVHHMSVFIYWTQIVTSHTKTCDISSLENELLFNEIQKNKCCHFQGVLLNLLATCELRESFATFIIYACF